MPPQPAPNPLSMLMPFAMMFLIFYVLVFRPQQTARRQHRQMLGNLKKHDEIVTSGGILGTVVNVKAETVILRIDDNVRVEVEKVSISRLVKRREGEIGAVSAGQQA